jgi:hypothetical protein
MYVANESLRNEYVLLPVTYNLSGWYHKNLFPQTFPPLPPRPPPRRLFFALASSSSSTVSRSSFAALSACLLTDKAAFTGTTEGAGLGAGTGDGLSPGLSLFLSASETGFGCGSSAGGGPFF